MKPQQIVFGPRIAPEVMGADMTATMPKNNNEQPVEVQIATPGHHFVMPDLFWAAVIFAALNILLLIWFTISPKLSLGVSGVPREERVAVADKPSPFTPVVDERRYARRQPEKVRPIVVATLDSLDRDASWSSQPQQVSWSQRTDSDAPAAAYVRGNAVYEVLDRDTNMPRLTAATYVPRNQPQVRHLGTQEMPRRTDVIR